jgi:hypothetical protein
MKPDRLADEISDHGQVADILVQSVLSAILPHAIQGQCADHLVAYLNGNPHEAHFGHRMAPLQLPPSCKQRFVGNVLHNNLHLLRHDLPNRPLWQSVEMIFRRFLIPAHAHHTVGQSFFIKNGDKPMMHVKEARQQP